MHKARMAAAMVVLVFPMLAAAQDKPTVKRVPVQTNSVVSGKGWNRPTAVRVTANRAKATDPQDRP